MTQLIENNPLFSRPQLFKFEGDSPTSSSLFSKNRALLKVLPSTCDPDSFFGKIQKLFWKIVGYFISLQKPSYAKFEALITNGEAISSTRTEDISQLFQRNVSEENKPLETLLKNCENLIEEIKRFAGTIDEKQRIQQIILFREKIKQKVQNLGHGESLLLPATTHKDINIFYLLGRSANGSYSLQAIGCDNWMAELSGIPTKKFGGKEKVLSQIEFKNIPSDYFNDERVTSLFCNPLLESFANTTLIKSHFEELSIHRIDLSDRSDLWVTRASNPRKAFGLVAQEMIKKEGKEKIHHKAARKRLEFQTKLLAFFDFYKEVRFDTLSDSQNGAALKQLVREIARETTLLRKKKYLSNEDLEDIRKELSTIEKTLAKAGDGEVVLGKIGKLPSLKISSEVLSIDKQLKAPVALPKKEAKSIEHVRQVGPLKAGMICDEDVLSTSISPEEMQALQSNQFPIIFELFKRKIEQANQHAAQGKKSLAVAVVMELVKNLKMKFIKGSCWYDISIEELLQAQNYFVEFSKLLAEQNTEHVPAIPQFMMMLKLGLYVEILRFAVIKEGSSKGYSSSHFAPVNDLIQSLFTHTEYNPDRYSPRNSHARHLCQLDAEGYQTLSDLLKLGELISKSALPYSCYWEKGKEEAINIEKKQKEYLCQMLGLSDSWKSSEAFKSIQGATKAFHNPIFIAALRQMEIKGDLLNVASVLSEKGKFNGSITYNGPTPEYHTAEWTHEEMREMQKDLDRLESLKLPEAVGDNPQAVFDQQMEDFIQAMKDQGYEYEFSAKDLAHQFRKEELTDLLYLLRGKFPQLEAVAFLKTHSHLLSNSDVRNYLETAIFDPSGSSFNETFEFNHEFIKTLPDILEEEVKKYRQLALEDSIYYDHLLFILSLVRKFEGIYQARLNNELPKADADEKISPAKFQDIERAKEKFNGILEHTFGVDKIHEKILQNSDLHQYHYKAILEYLLGQLADRRVKKGEVNTIIRLYHKLQTFSRDIYDIDPGELEIVCSHYALFINSLPKHDHTTLSPLLDQICVDQCLLLDQSLWKGEFPIYSNDQYEVNILSGQVVDYVSGTRIVAMPKEAMEDPVYKSTFGDLDLNKVHVKLTRHENTEIYLVEDKNGLRGKIEKEGEQFRFYKKFQGREKVLQSLCLKEIEQKKVDRSQFYKELPNIKKAMKVLFQSSETEHGYDTLHSLAGKGLFFDPETPDEGLCFDSKDNVQFKVKFNHSRTNEVQWTVTDCRGKKESGPYQACTLDSIAQEDLKRLEQFENGKDILVFAKQGKLKKVEFLRYGLSFTLKKRRLMCDHPKYQGYFIDLNASVSDKSGIPFSLALKHKDEEMPMKLILPDGAVLKNETIEKEKNFSLLSQLWILGKAIFNKSFSPQEFIEKSSVCGPQHTKEKTLKYHVFTVRPYTRELLSAETKEKMEGVLALLRQVLLNKQSHLALRPLKQLKLIAADLSKPDIDNILNFLRTPEESGEAASIKLQFAIKLKEALGDRVRFRRVSKAINGLIVLHCECYLRQGRKMDQRLCLDREQFEQMAAIVKKADEKFFDNHLRLFFMDRDKLPPFSPKDGTPEWKGYAEISLDENVKISKEKGVYGIEQIPLEILEKRLKPFIDTPNTLILKEEGTPLIYTEAELNSYFESKPLTLPDVKLPTIEGDIPSCERQALKKLNDEMEKYQQIIQGKNKHFLKADQILPLKEKIVEAGKTYSKLAAEKKKNIETLLLDEGNLENHLAIKGGLQPIATLHELSIAFLQKDLASLKNLIPADLDLEVLSLALKEYFEAEVKSNLLQNGLKILNKLTDISVIGEERWNQSTLLFQLLSTKQFYDPKQNPELLVFECFAQKTFRNIGDGSRQIDLLKELIEQPKGIIQAVTGAGKTTLLSVLRGLMIADGRNLVTFKILPTLFEQSKTILEEHLGSAFDKHIHCLRFNLKTPLIIREKKHNHEGQEVMEESSLFKKIYQDLLITIENKGCILTDYKSLPLMQEKWIKLNREFIAQRAEGMEISNIEKEHWEYLRKILILVQEREMSLMDEFDVPNRSCNRLQIPLGDSLELPLFLFEKSVELYEELRNDPRLKLSSDQQKDVFDKTREDIIQDLASKVAVKMITSQPDFKDTSCLLNYLLGKNEEFLDKIALADKNAEEFPDEFGPKLRPLFSPTERDLISFYKDQFCVFLPLALSKASQLDYKRSSNGTRTVPCHEGEPQESSKFGHPIEEINYTIQDYIQNGVSLEELKTWIKDLQDEMKKDPSSNIPLKQYAEIFPRLPFPKDSVTEEKLLEQLATLNNDWKSAKKFLISRRFTICGEVISMTPHDIASMPKTVLGLSATLGCPEELPGSFNLQDMSAKGIMGEMVYRLVDRTGLDKETIEFDPENPLTVFKKGKFQAVIDGSGALRGYTPSEVAEQFLSDQTHLKRVGYYNESQKLDFAGESDSTLPQKGFYFSKAKARGADISLHPEATALLTVDRHKTLEDLAQNDGRMRLKGQKIQLAQSTNNPISNTESLLVMCACNEGANHSVGLFRSKMQEIPHLVRQEAYQQLLAIENFENTLDQFEQWNKLFIQEPPHNYQNAGDYFKKNKHIRKVDHTPLKALEAKKEEWLEKATQYGLKVEKLESLSWMKELLDKCPPLVSGPDDHVSLGLEVEEEVEVEHEIENEMDVEFEQENEKELQFDQCGDVPYYPIWKRIPREYNVCNRLHNAFDPRINFLENFLPLERTDNLNKRTPFDKAMPKANTIHFSLNRQEKIEKLIFGDVLDAVYHKGYKGCNQYYYYEIVTKLSDPAITYDLRTRRPVDINTSHHSEDTIHKALDSDDFRKIIAQIRFINGEYKDYSEEEMKTLRAWLEGLANPEEMRQYFEKVILRTKPNKITAFKNSPLYKLFDDIAASK